MKARSPIAVWMVPLFAAACAGNSLILYEGPDRPGGEEVAGPARPSDYKFGGGTKREVDTNGDKRADHFEYYNNGELTGSAEDSNFDGKVDVYRVVANGKIVDEVRDDDFDGIFDTRARDTNGDGTLDVVEKLPPPAPKPPPATK